MKKILLVDDDADIRDSLAAILSKHFAVDTAQDGTQALAILKGPELPDLILLDVQMQTPQEGFELVSSLEKDADLSKIPVLLITSVEAITASEATADIVRKTRAKYDEKRVNVLVIKSVKGDVIVDYKSKKDGKTATIQVKGYHAKPVNPEKLINEIKHLLN